MNILLWILQIVLGVLFIVSGVIHFTLPAGLPAPMAWMYDLSPTLHLITGVLEILGGLGLILPGLFHRQTRLVPLAALGLALLMIGAAIWHIPRAEIQNSAMTLVLALLTGFVAYGRLRLKPLSDRDKA